jgi:hypothetical protein
MRDKYTWRNFGDGIKPAKRALDSRLLEIALVITTIRTNAVAVVD